VHRKTIQQTILICSPIQLLESIENPTNHYQPLTYFGSVATRTKGHRSIWAPKATLQVVPWEHPIDEKPEKAKLVVRDINNKHMFICR